MTSADVIKRVRNLKEFEVQIEVPENFMFSGTVPFDMTIVSNQAFVTVLAENMSEAVSRTNEFFQIS
jgi:hypothetical protein